MFDKDCFVSFAAVTCVKFLFIPLYKSTDFEVHRNWMAITYQKHLKDWYIDETSEWTLDYPPLFAWFEFLLAHLAKYFDSQMLRVENLNYTSYQTIFFMRASVILSDLVYFYGVSRIFKLMKASRKNLKSTVDDPWIKKEVILGMLFLWNPGLLLVDHIHFQYNGFLSGILLISIADIFEERYVRASFWFAVLINLKHIYLYLAPAYFLFQLKNYCCKKDTNEVNFYKCLCMKITKLGSVVIVTTLFSFGPFIYLGQTKQVLLRLFPVKRGLTHSYWAPNVWALYNFADRLLSFIVYKLGFYKQENLQACSTQGLVQECEPFIFFSISPTVTILLALLSFVPVGWIIWKKSASPQVFINSIILCSFGSFLFGYHVHEKAILLIILPLTIPAVIIEDEAKMYAFLSVVGHFSLLPLLHKEGETVLKIALVLLHAVYTFSSLSQLHQMKTPAASTLEKMYFGGLALLQVFYSFGAKMLQLEQKLPFLPLMLISTYCALGVVYSWLKYCCYTLEIKTNFQEKIKLKKY
ncbi:LOW QUALITY PROTEIN: probable dolichyl pyrophosphate Glc1Man9GlcNAc2 alpha-1,3-glucosyltransferase [Uloborus diversus]|uniref:LOW QUALITY PROTEIN: probable dolichyl pyrophosphate Glc1Man9GlcNAc2 alpha-1,3-glucosyltransferase n=1 Tax=Uloborus diversus TaxID=327109 RepID=UPI002409C260|nr:LOW QUALITY PROTEIN: probable dolichyl pyrophosphate Glc1Man9GlcNAc2 alpha-1,3-glucosyltransferase [Uloborus diversus]